MNAVEIIARKRDGAELAKEEIDFVVSGVTSGAVPDYQAAAWLMAVFLRSMTRRETLDLTTAMRDSGETIDLSDLANGPALDKHSTGGVGDKTSLVVIPILAAAGVPILKMSGHGLGFSGGTVDKLESISGFRTDLSIERAKDIVRRVGAVIIGQSNRLAPADKILYSLRDVTATIESIPLIAASIMSKKLAAGGRRILLDVKCGRGAFMKTRERAEQLAHELVAIGNRLGVPTVALITRMDEPLGNAIGNGLEVREAIETLCPMPGSFFNSSASEQPAEAKQEAFLMSTSSLLGPSASTVPRSGRAPFLDLCMQISAHGLVAAGKAKNENQGRDIASNLVVRGDALKKLVEIIEAQGGPGSADEILASLPKAAGTKAVTCHSSGFVAWVDAEEIGKLAADMGAGRHKKTDQIDPAVGIVLNCKTGSPVLPGITLATLHLREQDDPRADEFSTRLYSAFRITEAKPQTYESLVIGVVQ